MWILPIVFGGLAVLCNYVLGRFLRDRRPILAPTASQQDQNQRMSEQLSESDGRRPPTTAAVIARICDMLAESIVPLPSNGSTQQEISHETHRDESHRKKKSTRLPYDVKNMLKINDFSRPAPTKEDVVVILRNGRVKLAYVTDIHYEDLRGYPELCGALLSLEIVPSGVKVKRAAEEVYVIDRGFSLGETVVRYENEYKDDESRAIYRVTKHGQIGQVIGSRLTGDVLALPEKHLIVRNVDLTRAEQLELFNFNSAHNHILYQGWIGDVTRVVYNITLVYNGHKFTVRETGGPDGVYLTRRDRGDDGKTLVSGEIIQISIGEATGKFAKWEKEIPFKLRRFFRAFQVRDYSECITCVVEKVEPISIDVRWITSPSSLETPAETLHKDVFQDIARIDMSVNTRFATADRLRIRPTEEEEVITIVEYNRWIEEQFRSKFEEKKRSRIAVPGTSKGSDAPMTRRRCKSTGDVSNHKNEEGPPQKSPKLKEEPEADGATDSPSSSFTPMEVIHEEETTHVDEEEHMDDETSESDDDNEAAVAQDEHSSAERVARKTRSRKLRTRAKRYRRVPTSRPTPKLKSRKARDVLGEEYFGEVLWTRYVVDVEWMDGTVSHDVPGHELVPFDPDLDQQDHLPGMYVARKDAGKDADIENELGLILKTDQDERTATVRWFRMCGEDDPVLMSTEECTLFEIMPHPHYQSMFIGVVGVEIGRDVACLKDAIFQVKARLKNGKVLVQYLNGGTAELWPTRVIQLTIEEDGDDESGSSIGEFSGADIEFTDDEGEDDEAGAVSSNKPGTSSQNDSEPHADGTRCPIITPEEREILAKCAQVLGGMQPTATTGRIDAIVTGDDLPSSVQRSGFSSINGIFDVGRLDADFVTRLTEMNARISNVSTRTGTSTELRNSTAMEHTDFEEKVSEDVVPECNGSAPKGTVTSLPACSEHRWFNSPAVNGGGPWMRRVFKEIKTLQEHVPAGIHVFTYEDRVDLLSAVVVGPHGTPFEGTPFYFDVRFVADFPNNPPEVHYESFSQEQLNPNLYQSGKVCTSLLGTWQGKGIETWNPKSNMIQVLLSIQGLILVPEPYFNEAGYESRKDLPEMIAHSQRYNETALINSLIYMRNIYEKPPKCAKELIEKLAKENYTALRPAIQSWLDGRSVPAFPTQMSRGFTMALEKLVIKLDEVFLGCVEKADSQEVVETAPPMVVE